MKLYSFDRKHFVLFVLFKLSIRNIDCAYDIIDYVDGSIIDLTHTFNEDTIYFNGSKLFNITLLPIVDEKEYWVSMKKFTTYEHGGTHLDAQSHFLKNSKNVDAIDLGRLIGPAVIINCVAEAKNDSNYEVTVDNLKEWEKINGQIPKNALILLYFNWSERWPDSDLYFGRNETERSYPGLHPDAALWIVTERPWVQLVGTDTCSVDHGPTKNYQTHQILLGHEIYPLENLVNISRVPNFATVFAIPMKIGSGTGAPARVFAVVPNIVMNKWLSREILIVTFLYLITLIFVLSYRR